MGHKKVNSFAALDENFNLIVDEAGDPVPFMAEFTGGIFKDGSVASSTGTFSGTLTANAVDAADNINIGGAQVAATTSVFRNRKPTSGFFNEGQISNIVNFSLDVPSADTSGGVAIISAFFSLKNNSTSGGQANFLYQLRMKKGNTVVWENGWNNLAAIHTLPEYIYIEQIPTLMPGTHSYNIEIEITDANTNPAAYADEISVVIDYIRK